MVDMRAFSAARLNIILLASGGIGLMLAAYGLWIVLRSYSPLIYSDHWSTIPMIEAWLSDTLTLGDMHGQVNEHRILVPRLFYLIDYVAFSGNQVFLFATIVASNLIHALLLAWMLSKSSAGRLVTAVFLVLAAALMVSPAQYENLTWGFEVPWVHVYFFASVAFAGLAVMAERQAGGGSRSSMAAVYSGACVAALVSTYSMANGVIVWPIMAVMTRLLRLPAIYTVLTLVIGGAVIAIYMAGLRTSGVYNDYGDVLANPVAYMHFVTHYLAVPFKYIPDAPKVVIGGAVLALTAVTGIRVLLRPSAFTGWQIAFVAIAGFVLAAALITALGRVGYFGVERGVSKRYSTAVIVLYLALFGFYLSGLQARRRDGSDVPGKAAALIGFMAVMAVAAAAIYQSRLERWIGKVTGREQAILAYLAGARPADLLDLTGRDWRVDRFRANVDFLRRNRLTIFKDPLYATDPPMRIDLAPAQDCGLSLASFSSNGDAGVEIGVEFGGAAALEGDRWLIATDGDGNRIAYGATRHAGKANGRTVVLLFGPHAERPGAIGFAVVAPDNRVLCVSAPAPLPGA